MTNASIESAKAIGKWAITLTSPVWIIPVCVLIIPVMLFSMIHENLWNHRRQHGLFSAREIGFMVGLALIVLVCAHLWIVNV